MEATATGYWKQMLRQVPERDLYLLEEQIDAVIELPGWERIVAFITAAHGSVLRSLTTGRVREHADYARQVGYLAGLEEAPVIAQAIKEAADARRQVTEARLIADQMREEGRPQ